MKHVLTFLLLMYGINIYTQQIELQITGTRPFSIIADNYLDEVNNVIAVTIINNSPQFRSVKAYCTLSGHGLNIKSEDPLCNIDLKTHETKTFRRMNFENLCINFNKVDVNDLLKNSNLTDKQKNAFRISRILPEGIYNYCITLKDAVTNKDIVTTCLDIDITHPDNPVLINPIHESSIDGDRVSILNINWSHIVNDKQLREGLTYNVRIISLGNNINNAYKFPTINEANILLNDPSVPNFIEETGLSYTNKSYTLNLNDGYPFQPGHYYAIRVTAVNEDFQYPAASSQSNIHIFKYLNSNGDCGGNPNVASAYPISGQYIPFVSFPGICKVVPYCDYNKLDYQSYLTGENLFNSNYERKMSWTNGPQAYFTQKTGIPDPDGYYSSHLISFASVNNLPTFTRGSTYNWRTTGSFNLSEKNLPFTLYDTPFTVGMPPMLPNEPKLNDTLSEGIITLKAIHDKAPTNPLPPFKYFQLAGDDENIGQYEKLEVKEVCVIQISKKEDFSNILDGYSEMIEAKDIDYLDLNTRKYDQLSFYNDVYSIMTTQVDLTDKGKYYWRIGWMKIPVRTLNSTEVLSVRSEDLYHISTSQFVIGVKTNSNTGNNPNKSESECISPCDDVPDIVNTTDIKILSVSDTIMIGKFKMKLSSITKNGDNYSGEGKIEIPFVRNVKLKVVFNNIKVNTDKVVYNGDVVGKKGGTELKSLSTLFLGQDMDLPFGIETTLKDVKLTLAYTDITFSPKIAFAQVSFDTKPVFQLLNFEPDPALMPILSTNICITPGGYGDALIFHTNKPIVYQPDASGYGIKFNGGESIRDTTSMTYFRFNCRGFHSLQLAGSVLLSQSIFLGDSGNNTDDKPKNETVEGGFKLKYVNENSDWMIAGSMKDFQFKDLDGWGFDVDTFYIDISDNLNPPGFQVPVGYNVSSQNTWKGLFIPKINVLSPKNFISDTKRTNLGKSSMIMGDGVYYFKHSVVNLIPIDDGVIGRMKVSVDTVDILISNIGFKFKLNGKIKLPFVQEEDRLKYQCLYNRKNDYNFTIRPEKDLTVPLWKSKMILAKNSYFFLGKNNAEFEKFTFKVTLHGAITLDNETLGSSLGKGLKKIDMESISFQDLGYESGVGFTGDVKFGTASPKKSINGFPISLDTIYVGLHKGGPGLFFKPRFSLAGENNGFSVAGGLVFYGQFNKSTDLDFFDNLDIDLQELSLDVAFSGCTLKGLLKFINTDTDHGFEGVLAATFPSGIGGNFKAKFGNYKNTITPNATFGSKDYYNYWYVDALITFGKKGIPLFAGVNMYGIGGGMWYRMKEDGKVIKASEFLKDVSTDKNDDPTKSLVGYNPDPSKGYGIKIQGLFGDPAGGDKMNMLLAFQVSFNSNGGLDAVKFKGDVFIMSKMEDTKTSNGKMAETTKSLWGSANITYSHTEHFIDAQIDIYAKIKTGNTTFLKGTGPNDKVVNAHFYAESSKWFLYVGTPEKRGGIEVDAIVLKLTAKAYFMMGQGLPQSVPEPDPDFMAMLNSSNNSYSSSGGNVSSFLTKQKQMEMNTSNGIAFGAVVHTGNKFNFTPFYFDLKVILGMDINITQDDKRVCHETGVNPGHNGWYATGQMYAGLSGEFGIHIDLWLIDVNKRLFYGSVATLMKGGLPNPAWFLCKGTLKYDIVGLVKGQHSFEMQIGSKCTLGSGNPFGDMEIIQDTDPEDNKKDVSVFVVPKVSYAFAVNKELELYDDVLETTRKLKIQIKDFNLKKASTLVAVKIPKLVADNFASIHVPLEPLKSNTKHTFKIVIKALEFRNGIWKDVFVNGKAWTETKEVQFTTGIKPDSIMPEQIDITYPIQGQRYFLKNETQAGRGFISLTQTDNELLYTKKAKSKNIADGYNTFKYVIEFVGVTGGDSTKIVENISISNQNRVLNFDVSKLQNSKIYYAVVKRIQTNVDESVEYTTSEYYRSKADSYNYQIYAARQVTLHKTNTVEREKILLKYIFRTSKFSSFNEKMASFQRSEPIYSYDKVNNVQHNYSNITEDFEEYDWIGYTRSPNFGDSKKMEGIVRAGIYYIQGLSDYFIQNNNIKAFRFLNTDPILKYINTYSWHHSREYLKWQYGLTGATRTMVLNKVKDLRHFYLTMHPDICVLNFNMTKKPIKFPYSLASEMRIAGGFDGMSTPRKLKVEIQYGYNGVLQNVKNYYALCDRMTAVGYIMKITNRSMYNHISSYVNNPSGIFQFTIPNCNETKFGWIYNAPSAIQFNTQVTSKVIVNYKTPGPCNSEGLY